MEINKPQNEMDAQVRVGVESSHLDLQTLLINHGGSFGVFDSWGDIDSSRNGLSGLYHNGSRYLSRLLLKIHGTRPHLLSSSIREDNDMLSVDATNPRINTASVSLQEGVLHLQRSKFLKSGIYFEKISVANFSNEKQMLPIQLELDADFRDIFEVRGHIRKSSRPDLHRELLKDGSWSVSYPGLDQVQRTTRIRLPKGFSMIHPGKFEASISLNPGERKELEYDIHLLENEEREDRKVDLENHSDGLKSLEQEISFLKGRFARIRCSNALFNHWLERSQSDMAALLAPCGPYRYPFAGVPWFNTVFGRDGLITAFQLLMFAPDVARDVLLYLAEHQADAIDSSSDAEPGKILHEVRQGELVHLGEIPFRKYYGAIDSTPFYVWLAGAYFQRTNDRETLAQIWPHVKNALEWMKRYGDRDQDHFLEYERMIPHGLLNQCWKDSDDSISHEDGRLAETPIAVCEVQGYAYQAKLQGASLAEAFGEKDLAQNLRCEAKAIKEAFNQSFWSERLQYYGLALDREKKLCEVISSNPGHALATGIVSEERAKHVVNGLFGSGLNTEWGIRTLSCMEKRYNPMSYHNGSIWPHDNSMIAYGLGLYGFKKEVLRITKAFFEASLFIRHRRMPELYCGFSRRKGEGPTLYPVACSPQAWAVGSVYLFIQSFTGLHIDAPKKTIYLNNPALPEFLDELEISELSLGREKLSLRVVQHKSGVGVELIEMPSGWNLVVEKR